MYYNMFERPTAAQEDDIDLMILINRLARTIYDLPAAPACSKPALVRNIREAIAAASRGLNHTDAEMEIRAFCHYIVDPKLDRDGIDDLIADYINTAERMVEEGYD